MKGHGFVHLLLGGLVLAAAGLSLGDDKPKDGEKNHPKEAPYSYYAKVEVQGFLTTPVHSNELFSIFIPRQPKATAIPLNVSNLKGWKKEQLEQLAKCNGRDVRVTGTLEPVPVEVKPGVTEYHLGIIAETLQFLEKDLPEGLCPAAAANRKGS